MSILAHCKSARSDRDSAGSRLDTAEVKAFGEHIHQFYRPVVLPVSAPHFLDKTTERTYSIEELIWEESFGEDLCIADVNTKGLENGGRSFSEADNISAVMTNHFLYGESVLLEEILLTNLSFYSWLYISRLSH